MNDTQNETVRFSVKPNPFLYALEVTRDASLTWTAVGLISGIPFIIFSGWALVALLVSFLLLGLFIFMVGFATACCSTFIVTDKRAIVRFSSSAMTMDELSIEIETVKCIKINSYGATYGSVYLTYDETSLREKSKESEPDCPQSEPIRRVGKEATRASIPTKRTKSIWGPMSTWPGLHGFYAFKGFDEFANIISEQTRKPSPSYRT